MVRYIEVMFRGHGHSINLQVHVQASYYCMFIYIVVMSSVFINVMSRNILAMSRDLGHVVTDNTGTMSTSHEHANISNIRLCPGIVL